MGKPTLYGNFYKPALGASGVVEKGKFDDALDLADAQIKANENPSNIIQCSNYNHPDDAITAIDTANKTLLVTEAETCDNNFTVPTNVTVRFERGGKWTIDNGITVTFNGQIEAGLWQIFAYTGTGVIEGSPQVKVFYPQWWGAIINDDSKKTENTVAFNEVYKYKNVSIPEGNYYLNALDTITHDIKIIGTGISTVLTFDATTDCITLSVEDGEVYPLDEGVLIEDIRFDNVINVPTSFINVDTARNTKLVGLRFISAAATVGILNTANYGLQLQKCRWNHFTGIGFKLLAGDGDFSNAVNIFDCDFSHISGAAIEQEGGELTVFGGVIESSDVTGMVKLGTASYQLNASFFGTSFEEDDPAVFIKATTDDALPLYTANLIGCTFIGASNSIDIGAFGYWTFIGNRGALLVKTTTAHENSYLRVAIIGCSALTLDASVADRSSYIGRDEMIRATTANGSSVMEIYDSSDNLDLKFTDDGKLHVSEIRAISANGLGLYENGGVGVFIKDDGFVGVNETVPLYPLDVRWSSAYTSAALQTINLRHETSANMVDGFGTILQFQIEDVANVRNTIAKIHAVRDGSDTTGKLKLEAATTLINGVLEQTVVTMDDGDATPTVAAGNIFISQENTAPTEITDLDNPTVGQIVTIIVGHATNAPTIADGGNFKMNGNWTPDIDDSIVFFVKADNYYIEISRSAN